MSFLDGNKIKPTVSTLNVESIIEEKVQSEILLSCVIDVNTGVFENELSSESDKTSHGTPVIDVMNATSPECIIPELTFTNSSSKIGIR